MEISKFQKKPVQIDAVLVPGFPGDDGHPIDVDSDKNTIGQYIEFCEKIAEWCGGTSYMMTNEGERGTPRDGGTEPVIDGPHIAIPTLEGNHAALSGDYIIKGIAGEFYPCKPDIFQATYEQPTEGEAPDISPVIRAAKAVVNEIYQDGEDVGGKGGELSVALSTFEAQRAAV